MAHCQAGWCCCCCWCWCWCWSIDSDNHQPKTHSRQWSVSNTTPIPLVSRNHPSVCEPQWLQPSARSSFNATARKSSRKSNNLTPASTWARLRSRFWFQDRKPSSETIVGNIWIDRIVLLSFSPPLGCGVRYPKTPPWQDGRTIRAVDGLVEALVAVYSSTGRARKSIILNMHKEE